MSVLRQTLRHGSGLGKLKYLWRATDHWRKGYKWCVVKRFRCCDHTTPFHYQSCDERPA